MSLVQGYVNNFKPLNEHANLQPLGRDTIQLITDYLFAPKNLCVLHDRISRIASLLHENRVNLAASPEDVYVMVYQSVEQYYSSPLRQQIVDLTFPFDPIPLPPFRTAKDLDQILRHRVLTLHEMRFSNAVYIPNYLNNIARINSLISEINTTPFTTLRAYKENHKYLQSLLLPPPQPENVLPPPLNMPPVADLPLPLQIIDCFVIFLQTLWSRISSILNEICSLLR